MSNKEITLDSIQDIKKADYKKLFQKMSVWKKAKAVIVLSDYKIQNKKSVVAIPYKKVTEMKAAFKVLKAEKRHLLKKTTAGNFDLETKDDGTYEAAITPVYGNMPAEDLKMKGDTLFSLINASVKVQLEGEEASKEEEGILEKVSDLKTLALNAKNAFSTLKDDILPRFKSSSLSKEDLSVVEGIKTAFSLFQSGHEGASDAEKSKLDKLKGSVQKAGSVLDKISGFLGADQEKEEKTAGEDDKASSLIADIKKGLSLIKGGDTVKNAKAGEATDKDKKLVRGLVDRIAELDTIVEKVDNFGEGILGKEYDKIRSVVGPQVSKIWEMIAGKEEVVDTADEGMTDSEFKHMLRETDLTVKKYQRNVDKLEKDLTENKEARKSMPFGKKLLNSFF